MQIQMLARKRTDVTAPDPDTPRLLPSVHLAWAPLVGALQVRCLCWPWQLRPHVFWLHNWPLFSFLLVLSPPDCRLAACWLQDWRVSVIEAALQFLADAACLAGGQPCLLTAHSRQLLTVQRPSLEVQRCACRVLTCLLACLPARLPAGLPAGLPATTVHRLLLQVPSCASGSWMRPCPHCRGC